MTVYVSLPTLGRTPEQIEKAMDAAKSAVQSYYMRANVDIIPGPSPDESPPRCDAWTYWLGRCVQAMAGADCVYFAPEWYLSTKCRIEHEICSEYGLEMLDAAALKGLE